MNVFIRTYAFTGVDGLIIQGDVQEALLGLLHVAIFRTYNLTIEQQRIVRQSETRLGRVGDKLALHIRIILDDPGASSEKLTKFCQFLRLGLHRKFPADQLQLLIVASASPIGMSVDRDRK